MFSNKGFTLIEAVIVLLIVAIIALPVLGAIFLHPGSNDVKNTPNENDQVAGFWKGVVHGLCAPITFFISLFNHNVNVYEVHNNGGWYNFGFLFTLGPLIVPLKAVLMIMQRSRRRKRIKEIRRMEVRRMSL